MACFFFHFLASLFQQWRQKNCESFEKPKHSSLSTFYIGWTIFMHEIIAVSYLFRFLWSRYSQMCNQHTRSGHCDSSSKSLEVQISQFWRNLNCHRPRSILNFGRVQYVTEHFDSKLRNTMKNVLASDQIFIAVVNNNQVLLIESSIFESADVFFGFSNAYIICMVFALLCDIFLPHLDLLFGNFEFRIFCRPKSFLYIWIISCVWYGVDPIESCRFLRLTLNKTTENLIIP